VNGLGARHDALERLASSSAGRPFDVLVVGGGITGAGIALDAASRGLSVGLVERLDFASGTSSKSSKLVHGGLRYLEQREFGLIREASTERDLLRRLAPHLVEPIAFALPVSDRKRRALFGVGLWTYDALATFKNMKVHKHLDGTETEELVPPLPHNKVKGGFLFYDCKTDDVRLVMEVLVQARRYGAVAANYAVVRDLAGGNVCAATVEDSLTGDLFEVHAKRVIVAAGVWGDRLEALANEGSAPRMRPSKGVHLVFSRDALPMGPTGAFIPDSDRRRMLFVIPWLDAVIVGTTDTTYSGSLDRPTVEPADLAYCLEAVNSTFETNLSVDDVAGAYAGLRPLIAGKAGSTADLSRRHSVYDIAPGIVGITGGKLTTYRRMAADAVDRIAGDVGTTVASRTRWIRLGSSDVVALGKAIERRARHIGLGSDSAVNLVRCYGERAFDVLNIAAAEGLTDRISGSHPPITAEIVYGCRSEMAQHLNDLLARRTRLALTDRGAGLTGPGPGVMAAEHGWNDAEMMRQIGAHRMAISAERGFAVREGPDLQPVVPHSATG
jgi:glycerol-3-phosphate dehydrogenase